MRSALLGCGLVLGGLAGVAQVDLQLRPPERAGRIVVSRFYRAAPGPPEQQPRVEIRRDFADFDLIQLVAFRGGAKLPDVVIYTGNISVRQALMAGRIFVFQIGGGSRDGIYVLQADQQAARWVSKNATPDTAILTSDGEAVQVDVEQWGVLLARYRFPPEAGEQEELGGWGWPDGVRHQGWEAARRAELPWASLPALKRAGPAGTVDVRLWPWGLRPTARIVPASSGRDPCPLLLSTFYRATLGPAEGEPRVELRRCGLQSPMLQLVGYRGGAKAPDLVLDTGHSRVRQILMAGRVYVFQMSGGGGQDTLYIIEADSQACKLTAMQPVKDPPRIVSDASEVTVELREGGRVVASYRLEAKGFQTF